MWCKQTCDNPKRWWDIHVCAMTTLGDEQWHERHRHMSHQSCERNPSHSRCALENRVRQGKICEQDAEEARGTTVVLGALPTFAATRSQQSCERNPSCSRGAMEEKVRQGKFCEEGGGGKRNNSGVRGITNHHCHKKSPRDPCSVRGLKQSFDVGQEGCPFWQDFDRSMCHNKKEL